MVQFILYLIVFILGYITGVLLLVKFCETEIPKAFQAIYDYTLNKKKNDEEK